MTRSSWHHYWRLMVAFSVVLCALFSLAAVSSGRAPGSAALAGMPLSVQAGYETLAQAAATLLAFFWGLAAVGFSLAWAACAMALQERREAFAASERAIQELGSAKVDGRVDVEL